MGQLVNGTWSNENILVNHDDRGLYYKRDSVFRHHISSDAEAEFPAEPGRYHLYCAVACPWAHRATLMRTLKRLEPFVTLTNTFQELGGQGWSFGAEGHIVPGTDRRVRWLHELYTTADPACTTRVTVPTLWDAKTRRVVNNESSEIIRMFNTAFSGIAEPSPDYYPSALRPEIDATNALVLKGVNNAVNGCGYSITQEAYDGSVRLLFGTLDGLEARLAGQRYLCGEVETEADWRLFPSLVRFDPCYYVGYKCNLRRLDEYPNLSNYLRDLYQVPGIAETVDMDHIKRHYYASHRHINPTGIVPKGPALDLSAKHDRARRFERRARRADTH
jgi:putative glutathione S-transferase